MEQSEGDLKISTSRLLKEINDDTVLIKKE